MKSFPSTSTFALTWTVTVKISSGRSGPDGYQYQDVVGYSVVAVVSFLSLFKCSVVISLSFVAAFSLLAVSTVVVLPIVVISFSAPSVYLIVCLLDGRCVADVDFILPLST